MESNPHLKLGNLLYCHCTTPALLSSLLIYTTKRLLVETGHFPYFPIPCWKTRPAPVRVEFLRCISPSSPQSCVPFVGEERDCDRCPCGCACSRTAGEMNASANDAYLLLFSERFAYAIEIVRPRIPPASKWAVDWEIRHAHVTVHKRRSGNRPVIPRTHTTMRTTEAEEASKTLGLPRVPQNRKEGHDNASTKKQKTTDVIAVISLEPALWQIPF